MAKRKNKFQKNNSRDKRYDAKRGNRTDRDSGVHDQDQPHGEGRLSSLNDISWYTRYPNLLQAAGSFPFPYRPGMVVPTGTIRLGSTTTPTTMPYPGVMTINWIPTVGYSKNPSDPASLIAREMYSKVRSKFSSSLDVDPPDFLMYVQALDSIYAYIGSLKRIYRIISAYSPENYIIPDGLLRALGVYNSTTLQNLRQNKTRFWQSINELVLMSRRFTCPAEFDVLNRHYWLNDNVYTDAASPNAQFFAFKMIALYKYAPQNTPDGVQASGLEQVFYPDLDASNPDTDPVKTKFEFGKSLIEALSAWDDAYTINGYLMRAYEGAQLFQVDELAQDEAFLPVYVPEVLTQIENAMTPFDPVNSAGYISNNVSQDPKTNSVICNPQLIYTSTSNQFPALRRGAAGLKPRISIRSDTPSVADVVIATRMMTGVKNVVIGPSYDVTADLICGTEIVANFNTFVLSGTDVLVERMGSGIVTSSVTGSVTDNFGPVDVKAIAQLTSFDWHPILYLLESVNNAFTSHVQMIGDIHNITTVEWTDIENLHRICAYSEYNSFTM